jgi:hypothetical protein
MLALLLSRLRLAERPFCCTVLVFMYENGRRLMDADRCAAFPLLLPSFMLLVLLLLIEFNL